MDFRRFWHNIRPIVFVTIAIIVVLVVWVKVRPNKVQRLEKYTYRDKSVLPQASKIAHTLHLKKMNKNRYEGVQNININQGFLSGHYVELDFYPKQNVLDVTPIGKKINNEIYNEPKTKNKNIIKGTTALLSACDSESSKLSNANDMYGGLQLIIHTPKNNKRDVMYSENDGSQKYNNLKRDNNLVKKPKKQSTNPMSK